MYEWNGLMDGRRTHLEDEGLLGVELCDLEAVVPLLLPAEDAAAQEQRLPQGCIAQPLLLQQDKGRLPAAGLPWELRPLLSATVNSNFCSAL